MPYRRTIFTSIWSLTDIAPSANFCSIEAVLKFFRGPPSIIIIFFKLFGAWVK